MACHSPLGKQERHEAKVKCLALMCIILITMVWVEKRIREVSS
jgi:hypothetical protein